MFDLIVRGDARDIGVADGVIAAVEPELSGAREELDARGLLVLPGGLDPHVHFNEPGRTHWEGLATGSAALAAGGFTAFFDMPLNSSPPRARRRGLRRQAGGGAGRRPASTSASGAASCPGNLDRLEELAERGVIGLKAFMSNSGIDEFAHVDDVTLYEGMAIAARLGLPVAVHAENDALTARSLGPTARDWFASRPVVAELEAISRAILFASETGCALHIVHVSSGRGVALVTEARARGVDVTCETCPHYLFLTPRRTSRRSARSRSARRPSRRAERRSLWDRLGELDFVTSDHSPSSPDLKQGDFGAAWGGIAGAQSTLELLLGAVDAGPGGAADLDRRRRALPDRGQGPDRGRRRRRPRAGRSDPVHARRLRPALPPPALPLRRPADGRARRADAAARARPGTRRRAGC